VPFPLPLSHRVLRYRVCSQLAHVYNELEHDLRYKPLSGALSKREDDLLNALARLMEVGDTIINQTREAVEARQREQLVTFENEQDSLGRIAAHIRAYPALSIVTTSPLLLNLVGLVQASHPRRELPETPAELYTAMMRRIVNGACRSADAKSTRLPDTDELLGSLPSIAWRLFNRDTGAKRFDRRTLFDAVCSTGHSLNKAEKLIDHLVDLGFLASDHHDDEEQLEFCHGTFRDFLAASHVAARINRDGWNSADVDAWQNTSGWHEENPGKLLDTHAFEPSWESVIIFTAGLVIEPLSLIEMLADRKRDDLYRHRLGLLCRCYQALSSGSQTDIARNIPSVFHEILRIARRCEHDDAGHRKPWMEWVEVLLSSPAAVECLCDGLLALSGRYHGWAVSLKIWELFERVLMPAKVPPGVVDTIARFAERDEHQWGVNTARLALRLAGDGRRQKLVSRFVNTLERPETSDEIKVRLAEAVATSGDSTVSRHAGERLISLAQKSEQAVIALVSLLETSLAPIAAPVLVSNLLNPSSRHHFWLAWRIIGKAEKEPNSPWSAVFLSVTLFADREDDQRLKLWSAQVLTKHSKSHLRDLGFLTLLEMTQSKDSHSWVYAARWLVEHGPPELANKARKALFDEATNQASDERRVVTAELLEMGAIDPLGNPIQNVVHESVLRELEEHGRKYGSRLHVSVPGVPEGNVDLELFADNPAAVIKLLHTFNGPSQYLRDRDDPNEEERKRRYWTATLLHGTRYWPEVLRYSIRAANESADPDRDGALSIVLFATAGSELFGLLRKTVERGQSAARTRHYLLEELNERGWRFRVRGRQIEVLWKGREEPRAQLASVAAVKAVAAPL